MRISRRRFVKSAGIAAAAAVSAPAFLRGRDLNNRLNIAVIGVGGRGAANLEEVSRENIVALCDVYVPALHRASERFPRARQFQDFRVLFDTLRDYDAVVISTCEHTHAFATLPALQLGKHVYCEKPLTHSIWEARVIREAAARTRVATQMGIQIHALANYRRVVELVQSQAIGPVRAVHVWVNRAWGWHPTAAAAQQHQDLVFTSQRPSGSNPLPKGLNWDLWLGPAPERPFHEVYFPGPKWYRWWDFANGTMSDLGAHWNDLPFWALRLRAPTTITASGPPPHPELAPASLRAVYTFPARGELPPVTLTWYQGDEQPELLRTGKIPNYPSGVLFVGDKGMLLSSYTRHVLLPEDQFRDFRPPVQSIPDSPGHQAEWIRACKEGTPTSADFQYSGWLTESNHLGNVAYRCGQTLHWDAAALRATNCPAADPLIRREYRKGWKLV